MNVDRIELDEVTIAPVTFVRVLAVVHRKSGNSKILKKFFAYDYIVGKDKLSTLKIELSTAYKIPVSEIKFIYAETD